MKKNINAKKICLYLQDLFLEDKTILTKFISDITALDYTLIEGDIMINDLTNKELSIGNDKSFLVEFDEENNINVIVNGTSYVRKILKNVMCVLSGLTYTQSKIDDDMKLIQIHISYEDNCNNAVSKYRIREQLDDDTYQSVLCIELNAVLCGLKYKNSTEVENIIKWGALFNCKNKIEVDNVLKDIK